MKEGLKLKYFDGDEREENYEVGISPLVVMDSPGVESWWLGRIGAIMLQVLQEQHLALVFLEQQLVLMSIYLFWV